VLKTFIYEVVRGLFDKTENLHVRQIEATWIAAPLTFYGSSCVVLEKKSVTPAYPWELEY
jgi:hypothetical protein